MTTTNLWGTLPAPAAVRSPLVILRDQAALLSGMTDGLLVGKVEAGNYDPLSVRVLPWSPGLPWPPKPGTRGNDFEFLASLLIVAPTLGGYAVRILDVTYPLESYPVLVTAHFTVDGQRCQQLELSNEEDFVKALGRILSSREVKDIIAKILAQISQQEG